MSARPSINTAGWHPAYEIKGQCARCTHAITEQRYVACDYGKKEFPAASSCPIFKFDEDADE